MIITKEALKEFPKGFNVGDYILILNGTSRALNRIIEVKGNGIEVHSLVDGRTTRNFYGVNMVFQHINRIGKPLVVLSVEDFSVCF